MGVPGRSASRTGREDGLRPRQEVREHRVALAFTSRALVRRLAGSAKATYRNPMNATQTQVDLPVQHADGRFFMEQGGRTLAELIYEMDDQGYAVLEHTHIDEALRGQGVARRLVDAAVAWARRTGTRVVPVCSYARAIFARDRSLSDVLA